MWRKFWDNHAIVFCVFYLVIGILSIVVQNYAMLIGRNAKEQMMYRTGVELFFALMVIIPFAFSMGFGKSLFVMNKNQLIKGIGLGIIIEFFAGIPNIIACNVMKDGKLSFQGWDMLIVVVIFAFSIGLVEEMAVRGTILPYFIRKFGKSKKSISKAIILSSILFTVLHISIGEISDCFSLANILYLLGIFCFGFFMAVAALYFENIWCCVIAHTLCDSLAYMRFTCLPYVAREYCSVTKGVQNLLGVQLVADYDVLDMIIYLIFAVPELLAGIYLLKKLKNMSKHNEFEN